MEISDILPAAFYILNAHLAHSTRLHSNATSISAVHIVPGSVSSDHTPGTSTPLDALLSRLQPLQMSQLIYGRELLRTMTSLLVNSIIEQSIGNFRGCYGGTSTEGTSCATAAREWYGKVRGTIYTNSPSTCQWFDDPLRGFNLLKRLFEQSMIAVSDGICYGCRTHFLEIIPALRRYIWDELPYTFLIKPRRANQVYGYGSYM